MENNVKLSLRECAIHVASAYEYYEFRCLDEQKVYDWLACYYDESEDYTLEFVQCLIERLQNNGWHFW